MTLPPEVNTEPKETHIALDAGDMLVIYSDGVTDMQNVAGDFYEEARLEALLKKHAHEDASTLIDAVIDDLLQFRASSAQTDDVTLLVIKRSLPMKNAIAVVGTGYIGGEHIKAIAANPRAHLRTICTTPRSERIAKDLQATYAADRISTDYDRVLCDPEVDIVYLCTPNAQHADQAIAALGAGKHVFVEKPLAVTVEDCEKIVHAARRSEQRVMVGHGARFGNIFENHPPPRPQRHLGRCLFCGRRLHPRPQTLLAVARARLVDAPRARRPTAHHRRRVPSHRPHALDRRRDCGSQRVWREQKHPRSPVVRHGDRGLKI